MLNLPSPRKAGEAFHQRGFSLIESALSSARARALSKLAQGQVLRHGVAVKRGAGEECLDYFVVTGDHIQRRAASLFALYDSWQLRDWVRVATGAEVITRSPHLRSAININGMSRKGQRYPWHTDASPFSAVLFLTTQPPDAGGELLIVGVDGCLATIRPIAGNLVVFDGSRCPHSVAPLRESWLRLTLPMVFPSHVTERPQGLDDYLYRSCEPAISHTAPTC